MTFDFPPNDPGWRLCHRAGVEIGKAMGAKQVAGNPRKGPYTVTQYQTTHNTGGTIMGHDRDQRRQSYLQSWDVRTCL